MRVGLYVRVSTDDKGQNLDTQRMPLREFCRALGWTEVAPARTGAVEAAAGCLREAEGRPGARLAAGSGIPIRARRRPDPRTAAGVGGGSPQLPGALARYHQPVRRGAVLHHRRLRAVGARDPARTREGGDGPGQAGGDAHREAARDGAAPGLRLRDLAAATGGRKASGPAGGASIRSSVRRRSACTMVLVR